jgi:formate dehydrogenase subunit delta
MHAEYLVKMANQIGAFFHAESGPEAAPADIARHIQRFWDRRMKAAIVAHLTAGGEGLNPEVRRAVELVAGAAASKAAS